MKSDEKAMSGRARAQARDHVEIVVRACAGGSSPPGCGRSRTAPADAGTASAPAGRDARRSGRRPCRADGWWCSAAARCRALRRAGAAAGRASQARPSAPCAVIGVDVLADQRHLAHAGVGQALDLGDDLRDRPRDFGAARIGHDAEGAELVAAFLHGDEGGNAARARSPRGAARRARRTCPRPEIRCRRPARRARARASSSGRR